MMKLQARKRAGDPWRDITEDQLADICLSINGGGWTTSQTAKAMQLSRKIRDGGKYRSLSGFELRGAADGT